MSKDTDTVKKNRRKFLKLMGAGAGVAALSTAVGFRPDKLFSPNQEGLIDPIAGVEAAPKPKLTPYLDALVIPPALTPVSNPSYPGADYYEISIAQGMHKFHANLPATPTQSYFGGWTLPAGFFYLGPTIVANRGTPVVLKVTNNLPLSRHLLNPAPPAVSVMDYTIMGNTVDGTSNPASRWPDEHRTCVHLHGGKVLAVHDGGPRDWFSPVGSTQDNPYPEADAIDPGPVKTGSHTYEYPNDQPSSLIWYHDHAWGITRFNPFLGQAAAYIVRDAYENDLINGTNDAGQNATLQKIPSGAYEVPIVLQDRLLNPATGAQIYPITAVPGLHPIWIPEYFGDTPVVNGKAYPFLNVEPRRYRFRFLNGSQARFYTIWFNDPLLGPKPFWVIGSEQGFLPTPVMLTRLTISPGERFDTIFDFTGMPNGTILTLKNNAKAPYPNGRGGEVPNIMQFRVVTPLVGADPTTVPSALTLPPIDPPLTPDALTQSWREIVLSEVMDPTTGQPLEVLLDGKRFLEHAPPNPPIFTETDGDTNVWQFINTTGDAHPMHLHLVKFKVVNRQPFDAKLFLAAWNAWVAGNPLAVPPIPPRDPATRPTVNLFLLGAPNPPAPEETGWKDTAKAMPGEVLRIIAKFDLPAGAPTENIYVCHCHILEHEENDMMFYFGVNK